MSIIIIIIISILPEVLLSKYIYLKDTEKKPKNILKKLIIYGALACFLSARLEELYSKFFLFENNSISYFLKFIIGVALIEEFCKFFVAYYIGVKSKHFNDIYDAIVYTSFSALGFAITENLYYNLMYGIKTAIFRTITALGHMSYGIIMGYFIGIAYKNKKNNNNFGYKTNLLYSILIPTIVHGLYDFGLKNSYGEIKIQFIIGILALLLNTIFIIYTIKIIKKISKNKEIIK